MKTKSLAVFLSLLLFAGCLSGCDTITNDTSSVVSVVSTTSTTERLVWIPTHGGIKYHRTNTCSNMIDPDQVTLRQAEQKGFTPCKKCYG